MDLEGISNACKMNVMMKSPVTRTADMEEINSIGVSPGLAGLGFCRSAPATPSFCLLSAKVFERSTHQAQHAFPAHVRPRMSYGITQISEFIIRSRWRSAAGRAQGKIND